jgi:hypothetical protein
MVIIYVRLCNLVRYIVKNFLNQTCSPVQIHWPYRRDHGRKRKVAWSSPTVSWNAPSPWCTQTAALCRPTQHAEAVSPHWCCAESTAHAHRSNRIAARTNATVYIPSMPTWCFGFILPDKGRKNRKVLFCLVIKREKWDILGGEHLADGNLRKAKKN